MADLPQSWHAGTEAQPLIRRFELLAQLSPVLCRLRSPLATSGRITMRQSSDNVTAGTAIMKGFTTKHPLRRFVQVITRWATISCVKLEVDLPGIDNEWADGLSRNKAFIKGFFPPEQRIEFSVNDLLRPGHQPRRVPEHDRWSHQLRKLESISARRWFSMAFDAFSVFREVSRCLKLEPNVPFAPHAGTVLDPFCDPMGQHDSFASCSRLCPHVGPS